MKMFKRIQFGKFPSNFVDVSFHLTSFDYFYGFLYGKHSVTRSPNGGFAVTLEHDPC